MKAVILCGGKGTRLKEETEYKPKPLVEIGGKPILWHVMKIYASQGVKDFILCLGYKGNMIKDYFLKLEEMSNDFVLDLKKNKIYHLSDIDELDVTIHFVNTGDDAMTGARIARIKKFVENDEDFFMTYGDGLADIDLCELYKHHKKNGKAATLIAVNPEYRYGLVEMEGDSVIRFDEKPNMKDLVNGGFMVLNKKIFDYISTDKNCIFEQEPMRKLASDKQLVGFRHKGFWMSMDTQKDVDELNKIYNEGQAKGGAPWEIWKKNKISKNLLFGISTGDRIISIERKGFWSNNEDKNFEEQNNSIKDNTLF
jgi:glucose-1-phosphate cytidylyltransferase